MTAAAVQVRDGLLLALLEQQGSLACEQAAAQLGERPDSVRSELESLRERGLVGVFGVGELRGYVTTAAAYWRITAEGRDQLRILSRAVPPLQAPFARGVCERTPNVTYAQGFGPPVSPGTTELRREP